MLPLGPFITCVDSWPACPQIGSSLPCLLYHQWKCVCYTFSHLPVSHSSAVVGQWETQAECCGRWGENVNLLFTSFLLCLGQVFRHWLHTFTSPAPALFQLLTSDPGLWARKTPSPPFVSPAWKWELLPTRGITLFTLLSLVCFFTFSITCVSTLNFMNVDI